MKINKLEPLEQYKYIKTIQQKMKTQGMKHIFDNEWAFTYNYLLDGDEIEKDGCKYLVKGDYKMFEKEYIYTLEKL